MDIVGSSDAANTKPGDSVGKSGPTPATTSPHKDITGGERTTPPIEAPSGPARRLFSHAHQPPTAPAEKLEDLPTQEFSEMVDAELNQSSPGPTHQSQPRADAAAAPELSTRPAPQR